MKGSRWWGIWETLSRVYAQTALPIQRRFCGPTGSGQPLGKLSVQQETGQGLTVRTRANEYNISIAVTIVIAGREPAEKGCSNTQFREKAGPVIAIERAGAVSEYGLSPDLEEILVSIPVIVDPRALSMNDTGQGSGDKFKVSISCISEKE